MLTSFYLSPPPHTHTQHTFVTNAYVRPKKSWTFVDSALRGSADHAVPLLLRWFLMGVEHHGIHHLCPRVPVYRLHDCFREGKAQGVWPKGALKETSLTEQLNALALVLYDEEKECYVSFANS